MFTEVPVLPVVVPLAAGVFLGLLGLLRSHDMLSAPRATVALLLSVYAGGVVANTVFPIYLDKPAGSGSWKVYLVPLIDYEVADAVMNVLVFLPVGILAPLLLTRASWTRVAALAAASSLVIETTQLVSANLFGGGHLADLNDLLFNVLGGLFGYGVFLALSRAPGNAALIDRVRWR